MKEKFELTAKVCKVDTTLGLVFGWAMICKEAGEDYFDLQGHNIPEDSMLVASADFMKSARVVKDMHQGDAKGTVLYAFPMTAEIQKAFDITCPRSGLIVGVEPSPEMLAKFASGEYTGFSIGGYHIELEDA